MSEMRKHMEQRHEFVSTLLAIYRNEHARPKKRMHAVLPILWRVP